MASTKALSLILIIAVISSVTCKRQMPAEYKEFFDLPLQQQVQEFSKYPIGKQLDLYLYDWNYRHPAQVGFAFRIAEKGESVVPTLIDRLNDETNENSQDAILYIFGIMSERGSLRGRQDVVDAARRVTSNMKNPGMKRLSQERLEKIEKAVTS